MNDCGICFEIMERDLWNCEQCEGQLHKKCYKHCNGKCPFCRYLNSDTYTDCTLCCVGIVYYICNTFLLNYL